MPRSRVGFSLPILIALLAIGVARSAAAQDMPAIFGSPDLPAATVAKPAPANPAPVPPSAQATIAPLPTVPAPPARKPQIVAVKRPMVAPHRHVAAAAEKRKFAELMRKLAPPPRHETVHRVVVREVRHELPPGTRVAPPPGYYGPGPYARLVWGGPRGPYGWGGYPRPYPYYGYQ